MQDITEFKKKEKPKREKLHSNLLFQVTLISAPVTENISRLEYDFLLGYGFFSLLLTLSKLVCSSF